MSDRIRAQVIPFPRPASPHARVPIALRDIRLRDAHSPRLDRVTLDLSPDGISAIIGPNGAGKSALLQVLAGLSRPDAGSVQLPGPMQGRVALVPRRPALLRRSVAANIAQALRLARWPRARRRARLEALLAMGRLADLDGMPAARVPAGAAQRLAIVRALASDPRLLLLDDPGPGLDPPAAHALEALLSDIVARGTKLVLVSQDLGQVARVAGEIAFLHAGRCHEVALAAAFLDRPRSPAGRAYLDGRLLL